LKNGKNNILKNRDAPFSRLLIRQGKVSKLGECIGLGFKFNNIKWNFKGELK